MVDRRELDEGALDLLDVRVPGDRVGALALEREPERAARDGAGERDRDDLVEPLGEVERALVPVRRGSPAGRPRRPCSRRRRRVRSSRPKPPVRRSSPAPPFSRSSPSRAVERHRAEREGRRVDRVRARAAGQRRALDPGERGDVARAVAELRVRERDVGVALGDDPVDAEAAGDACRCRRRRRSCRRRCRRSARRCRTGRRGAASR